MMRSLDTSADYPIKDAETAIAFIEDSGASFTLACQSVPAPKSAYQTAIDTCHVAYVDVEAASRAKLASMDRNFLAIALLQSDSAAQGKPWHVTSYRLAMAASDLASIGKAMLDAAIANHTMLNALDVMPMDFGSRDFDMGTRAINTPSSVVRAIPPTHASLASA
ncbi:chitinase [Burkholderia ambifaria IOP40-10]|uniref:Chitinase n=1 Tax=Burkholderia ambifaria IOP40-10 TaxID=396596 RepID=B1FHG2_9BURK|nr:hypothetical protein [Burkholderia ambifaria]EDT03023.1 chitinase [Burkholderia ambifaria IOP40-10]